MKLLWVVTCICCTFSIWLWNLYAHIPTLKDVRNIPPTKKQQQKNTIPSAAPDIKKLNHPNNHTQNQPTTHIKVQARFHIPSNRSKVKPPTIFSTKHRGDGTSALLIHGIFIAFRFQQHSHNVHIAKLCCCRHGRTTMLILSFSCDVNEFVWTEERKWRIWNLSLWMRMWL